MEGSVLSFLKAEWKVSDTGSAHWASSYIDGDIKDILKITPFKKEINTKNKIHKEHIFSTFCSLLCSFIKCR